MSSEAITTNDLKNILNAVLPVEDPNVWEEFPLTITVTTGDLVSGYIKAYKCGDLLQVEINDLNRAAATSAGGNMFTANISGFPKSFLPASATTYNGSSAIIVYIKSTALNTATITARVIGAQLAANAKTGQITTMSRFI